MLCKSNAAYSSACACLGVSHVTTTLVPCTNTITVTNKAVTKTHTITQGTTTTKQFTSPTTSAVVTITTTTTSTTATAVATSVSTSITTTSSTETDVSTSVAVVSTTTVTDTVPLCPTAASDQFYIAMSSEDGTYNNDLLATLDDNPYDDVNVYTVTDLGGVPPTLFSWDPATGYFGDPWGRDWEQDNSESPSGPIYIYNLANSENSGYYEAVCSFAYSSDGTACNINCDTGFEPGQNVFSYCGPLYIGQTPSCTQVTLNAIVQS